MKAVAILKKNRMSPRKVRIVADMIRGMDVVKALDCLKHDSRKASTPMSKLLLSSISNWHNKNGSDRSDELFIYEIRVDVAGMLKRIKPAPQGRAHKIRKRFNHITIAVESKSELQQKQSTNKKTELTPENKEIPQDKIDKKESEILKTAKKDNSKISDTKGEKTNNLSKKIIKEKVLLKEDNKNEKETNQLSEGGGDNNNKLNNKKE